MSDTYSQGSPFGFFNPEPRGPVAAPSYEQLQMRRKLALALAAQKRAYPKTIGEGLTALGEGWSQMQLNKQLAEQEAAYNASSADLLKGITDADTGTPRAPAAPAPVTPAPAPAPTAGASADAGVDAVKMLASATSTEPGAPASTMPTEEWLARNARNETGGVAARGLDPYQAVGPQSRKGDYPYGKYQIMGKNIPKWSQQYLGRSMTPEEFLADPDAQETIARGEGERLIAKHGPEKAAAAWFAGEKGMLKNTKATDVLGTDIAAYVQRFNRPLEDRGTIARSLATQPPGASPALADVEQGALPADTAATGVAAAPQGRVQLAARGDIASDAAPIGRDAIAQSLAQQQAPTAQPPQQVAEVQAPVPAQQIPKAPPAQQPSPAQAGQPPYPDPTPMSDQERKARLLQSQTNDPAILQRLKAVIEPLETQRKFLDTRKAHEWDIAVQEFNKARDPLRASTLQTQEQERKAREQQITTAARDEALKARVGRNPQEFFKNFDNEHTIASNAAQIIDDNRIIMKALQGGVIQGFGANARLNLSKLGAWALQNGYASEQAANTEIARALGASRIREAMKAINPSGPASNTDVAIARQLSGTEPTMEPKAFLDLLRKSSEYNSRTLNDFEDKRDHFLSGLPEHRMYQIPSKPTAPDEFISRLLEHKDNEKARKEFDNLFGDGSAQLEIDRAKRKSRQVR